MACPTVIPISTAVASICRLPNCTGRYTECRNNSNANQRRKHIGKSRSSSCWLKSNPNVLECLYTPLVERTTPLADELLAMRSVFLSRLVYQTYNGYVMSQFKKMQADFRNQGQVKWKHVMHLIRLLISGISVLREGFVPVRVDEHREQLLAIKRGKLPWEETEKWRIALHTQFDKALEETKLPERPDYEKANAFLIKARRAAIAEGLP